MTRDMRCPMRFCVYERDTDILSLHDVWNDKAGNCGKSKHFLGNKME